jgi:histidinol-phosphatase (PHP family)
MLSNYHAHSNYTSDAQCTIEQHCKAAVEQGLDEICFTQHLYYPVIPELGENYDCPDSVTILPNDVSRYFEDVENARLAFPGLKIKIGFEADYIEGREERLQKFLESKQLDFVLGSVHFIQTRGDLYTIENVRRMVSETSSVDFVRRYFEKVLKSVECGIFDSISHASLFSYSFDKLGISSPPFESYPISLMKLEKK